MTATLALAVGIPLALGAICLVSRRSRPLITADTRGIALQTVIVIVVMLVIAGGVSGVLLSRGGEVISDLENQDVSTNEVQSQQECDDAAQVINTSFGGGAGTSAPAATVEDAAGWAQSTTTCTVNGLQSDSAGYPHLSTTTCERVYEGTYTAGTATNAEKCVIT